MPVPSFWESPGEWWDKSSRREKGLSFLLLAAVGTIGLAITLYSARYVSFETLLVIGIGLAGIELAVGIYVGMLELEDIEKGDELEVLREILSEIRLLRREMKVEKLDDSPSHAESPPTRQDG